MEEIQKKLSSKSFTPSSVLISGSRTEHIYDIVSPNSELKVIVEPGGDRRDCYWLNLSFCFKLDREECEQDSNKTPQIKGAIFTSSGENTTQVLPIPCSQDVTFYNSNDSIGIPFEMIVYIEPSNQKEAKSSIHE